MCAQSGAKSNRNQDTAAANQDAGRGTEALPTRCPLHRPKAPPPIRCCRAAATRYRCRNPRIGRGRHCGDYLGSSMDDISFVAAAGATVVAGLMMWWACGRYQSRLKRALFGVAAVFLGFFAYLVLGILFVVMRPDVARETGSAIFGHGVKTLSMMLLAVNIVVLNVRRRPKAPRPGA